MPWNVGIIGAGPGVAALQSLRAPERYESSARLALRRAIDACLAEGPAADLEELLQDMALTRALLDA